jgi:sec-independent protein translocase protein TatB
VRATTGELETQWKAGDVDSAAGALEGLSTPVPEYRHPKKNWRLKRGAMPAWYKQRAGIRTKALSGAARVARYRPRPLK